MTEPPRGAAQAYRTGCLSKDLPSEGERLRLQERLFDPATVRIVETIPLEPTWRCLEVGAGAGSIARHLADRCPRGEVVAVDVDTRFLGADRPNLTVVAADIAEAEFPRGSFDLVHVRMVLCHLPARDHVLAKLVEWLAPGGWVVVEEPYFFDPATSPYPAVGRLFEAVEHMLAAHGADMRWARRVPGALAGLLGAPPEVSASPGPLGAATGLNDELTRVNIHQVGPLLVDRGLLTADELRAALSLLDDPTFLDLMSVNLSVWGRKAS